MVSDRAFTDALNQINQAFSALNKKVDQLEEEVRVLKEPKIASKKS